MTKGSAWMMMKKSRKKTLRVVAIIQDNIRAASREAALFVLLNQLCNTATLHPNNPSNIPHLSH